MSGTEPQDLAELEVVMLLCDAAQSIGGKLYILGGGWTRAAVSPANPVIPMALAVKIAVPWHLANEQMPFRAALVEEDGAEVLLDNQPMQLTGVVELGRPPGLRPGTPLDAVLAISFQAPLGARRYRWEFWMRNRLCATAAFEVVST